MLSNIKSSLKGNMRQYGMVFALVVVVLLFYFLTDGIIMTPRNISNIIQQNGYVMILACGMLLCILTGGNVDLSVGSVVGFVGAVSAVMILRMGVPVLPGMIISLLIGILIGAWHGFWIAYAGVPAFIATLAGQLIFRGCTMAILQGTSIAPLPDQYTFIGAGFIPDPFAPEVDQFKTLTVVLCAIACIIFIVSQVVSRNNKKKYGFDVEHIGLFAAKLVLISGVIMFFAIQLAQYRGLPTVLVLVVALVLIYTFITNKTVVGRHIYAFGGNAKAAKLSGIKTSRIMFLVYTNMGLLAALAGLVFTGRLNSATPKNGDGFELDAIAACFIGGASTSGGIGTIVGAIVGGLLMGVLNNGMNIMGVSIDWQQAIKGAVLLVAVAFDVLSKKNKTA